MLKSDDSSSNSGVDFTEKGVFLVDLFFIAVAWTLGTTSTFTDYYILQQTNFQFI